MLVIALHFIANAEREAHVRNQTGLLSPQVDVNDASKTAEAFLKISSVYKDQDEEVKIAVLDSIGEGLLPLVDTFIHSPYKNCESLRGAFPKTIPVSNLVAWQWEIALHLSKQLWFRETRPR